MLRDVANEQAPGQTDVRLKRQFSVAVVTPCLDCLRGTLPGPSVQHAPLPQNAGALTVLLSAERQARTETSCYAPAAGPAISSSLEAFLSRGMRNAKCLPGQSWLFSGYLESDLPSLVPQELCSGGKTPESVPGARAAQRQVPGDTVPA